MVMGLERSQAQWCGFGLETWCQGLVLVKIPTM